MSDRDDAAAAYYEDPENRQLKGPGQKRSRQPGRLTAHVPIRFSSGIIERVKDLASDDGKTVSSWIRDVIEREVLRRERSSTVGVTPTVQWKERTSEPLSSTLSSSEQNTEELHRLAGLFPPGQLRSVLARLPDRVADGNGLEGPGARRLVSPRCARIIRIALSERSPLLTTQQVTPSTRTARKTKAHTAAAENARH